MLNMISSFIATMIVMNKWRFFSLDSPLSAEEVASNDVLLPVLMWQAEKTYQKVQGKSLGIQFKSDENAAIGARTVINSGHMESRSAFVLLPLEVLVHSIENFTKEGPDSDISAPDIRENILRGGKIPPMGSAATIDHLIQGFYQDQELGLIPWTPDSVPRAPSLPSPSN